MVNEKKGAGGVQGWGQNQDKQGRGLVAGLTSHQMWQVREEMQAAGVLTPSTHTALGLHIDAAILAPSNAGVLANLAGSLQDALNQAANPASFPAWYGRAAQVLLVFLGRAGTLSISRQ